MKTYNSPMLQVVSINKKDIIVTSPVLTNSVFNPGEGDPILSAGRRYEDWYEGY